MPAQDYLTVCDGVSRKTAEALVLLERGLSDEEIAAELGVSVRAARGRLARFYAQTDLHGRRAGAWVRRHEVCCLYVKSS
jgi:DNA-directed RNA polymerase specialized sigma24 family protein